jgi:hypothetical protein
MLHNRATVKRRAVISPAKSRSHEHMSYSAPAPVRRGFSLARASALAPAVWAPGNNQRVLRLRWKRGGLGQQPCVNNRLVVAETEFNEVPDRPSRRQSNRYWALRPASVIPCRGGRARVVRRPGQANNQPCCYCSLARDGSGESEFGRIGFRQQCQSPHQGIHTIRQISRCLAIGACREPARRIDGRARSRWSPLR